MRRGVQFDEVLHILSAPYIACVDLVGPLDTIQLLHFATHYMVAEKHSHFRITVKSLMSARLYGIYSRPRGMRDTRLTVSEDLSVRMSLTPPRPLRIVRRSQNCERRTKSMYATTLKWRDEALGYCLQ